MEQHLSSRSACEIVAKEEAEEFLSGASSAVIDCVSLKGNGASSNGMKHVMRCLDQGTRISVVRRLGKSREGKFSRLPCRPVVAIIGSQARVVGRQVGAYLQQLLLFYKTCVKNSDGALRILRDFRLVFDDFFVTTCEEEEACPNVNTDEELVLMMVALDAFIFKVKLG